jgi:hypothetical protein
MPTIHHNGATIRGNHLAASALMIAASTGGFRRRFYPWE